MQVFETLDLPAQPACSVALGAFDGLHRGHMAVIQAALATRLEPAVCTFRSSPSGEPMLATPAHKALLLRQAGVRRLYTLDFPSVKAMPPQTFVEDVLFRRLHARHLCCGEDFRFGHAASGDANLLARLCQAGGVTLSVLPPVTEGGEKISSTRIRQAIRGGDIPLANRLLGRPFGFTLEVIHGNHLGSTQLGAPTINQALPAGFVLPRFGVYAAWCRVGGQAYYGVCNIGVKPTVGSDCVLAETWMPDFSGDLYGQEIPVSLLAFIRPERKFPSLEELRAEIHRNARQAQAIAQTLQTAP